LVDVAAIPPSGIARWRRTVAAQSRLYVKLTYHPNAAPLVAEWRVVIEPEA